MDELLIKRIYNSMIGKKLISDSEIYAQPDKVSNTETAYPGCRCRRP